MITLTQHARSERAAKTSETQKPSQAVETSGSLAMLFENGLMTIAQYDEFIASNPFAVDYSAYANENTIADGGFLSDFANAVSTLGEACGASFGGFAGGECSGGSCGGGFTSVC